MCPCHVAETLTEHRFDAGVTLTNQGQECTGIFMLLSGTVALVRRVDTAAAGPGPGPGAAACRAAPITSSTRI